MIQVLCSYPVAGSWAWETRIATSNDIMVRIDLIINKNIKSLEYSNE
jgi:hypothetical protein